LDYDTNAKVAPPLRSASDREAVIEGLIDGTIDCIATDHAPHTIEDKEMDFINSPCGMIGLESAFGLCHTVMTNAGASSEDVIKWLTKGPATVMGWKMEALQIGQHAEIVIIDTDKKWTFNKSDIKSRSNNSPIVGMEFTGKVISVISGKYSFGILLD